MEDTLGRKEKVNDWVKFGKGIQVNLVERTTLGTEWHFKEEEKIGTYAEAFFIDEIIFKINSAYLLAH